MAPDAYKSRVYVDEACNCKFDQVKSLEVGQIYITMLRDKGREKHVLRECELSEKDSKL